MADAEPVKADERRRKYRRREDDLARLIRRRTIEQRVFYVVVILIVSLGFKLIGDEADERQDGQCRVFESDHLTDVTQLQRTYSYFATVTPEDYDDTLYKFAARTLPETEAKAYLDPAPAYCDDDGVGLPEPDPTIPRRPPGLKALPGIPPPPKTKPTHSSP